MAQLPGPQPDDFRPPGIVEREDPDAENEQITEDDAVEIAREEGMRRIDRIREGRRGWLIVGIDRNGDDMRIIISRAGEIIEVQRD